VSSGLLETGAPPPGGYIYTPGSPSPRSSPAGELSNLLRRVRLGPLPGSVLATRLRAFLRTNPRAAHKGAVLQAGRSQPRAAVMRT
jgi:hypothetical protein